jgi:molecular chaperone DnaK
VGKEEVPGPIVGADLGITNSTIAFLEAGEATIIENSEGMRTTPTAFAIAEDQHLVGIAAKRQVCELRSDFNLLPDVG